MHLPGVADRTERTEVVVLSLDCRLVFGKSRDAFARKTSQRGVTKGGRAPPSSAVTDENQPLQRPDETQAGTMFDACLPLGPCFTSNVTF